MPTRRQVLVCAASSTLLASCAHHGRDVKVLKRPAEPITALDMFVPLSYTLGVRHEEQIARFKTQQFGDLFTRTTSELLAHNGISGRGITSILDRSRERHLVVFEPAGLTYWYTDVVALNYQATLAAPTGERLMSWTYETGMGRAVFNPAKWSDYDTAVAFLVLASLRTMQDAGFVSLKYRPPVTMAGSQNPGVGSIR